MATRQRCPKCNHLNPLDAAACEHCHAPLQQHCPICGTSRPWYVTHCPNCRAQPKDVGVFAELFRETQPQRLGKYIVRHLLSRSRVSAVYLATPASDPTVRVAIKELSTVALFRPEERRETEVALRHELEAWSVLSHPALAKVLETFRGQDGIYVVFEYVDGQSARRIISDPRLRVTPALARNWGGQLADLLAELHSQTPPLHVPFLAPSHVMVNSTGQVKLVGLGLSRLFRPDGSVASGAVRGYAAPELKTGVPTVQSDIFALGRLLFALLTGQLLETGRTSRMTLQQAVPGIAPDLVRAIARAAHKDATRRFASAAEFAAVLWSDAEHVPMADWMERARVYEPVIREQRKARPSSQELSMVDLGFARDPRFGAEPAIVSSPSAGKPNPKPELSVYPRHLNFGTLSPETSKRLALTVRNLGDGELTGRVISHVSWLHAPQKPMRIPVGKQARVLITLRAGQLSAGKTSEPQALSVESNAGRQWVATTAEIPVAPLLQVDPLVLDFGDFDDPGERQATLTLSNGGSQPLSGSLIARVPWLRLSRRTFSCGPASSTRITVSLLTQDLPRGPQDIARGLLVESDGGQERIAVRVWWRRPELDLGVSHMDLGVIQQGQVAERFLYLGNTGDGLLRGAARSLLPWLQIYPTEFECEPGQLVQLTVSMDPAGLADGALDVPQAVRIQTNAGTRNLSLGLHVSAPRLVLEPERIDLGTVTLGEVARARLLVCNEGTAILHAIVQPLVNWLTVSEHAVSCEPHQAVPLVLCASTESFSQGQQVSVPAGLRIVAGSDVREIPVAIRVIQPALNVEPEMLDFGYVDPTVPEVREVIIRNKGTGDLAWQAQTDAAWLELVSSSGICHEGEEQRVTLRAYGLALESGVASEDATLVVNSDGGRQKIPVRIALAAPLLASDTTYLALPPSINLGDVGASLRIFNHGLGLLRGTLETDQTWLALDRVSFECEMGRSIEVHVTTDMAEFPSDETSGRGVIAIKSNGGDLEIEVAVEIEKRPQLVVPEDVLLQRDPEQPGGRGRLVLRNTGLAVAHVQLEAMSSWLTLSRHMCDIKPGKSVRVGVSAQAEPDDATEPLCVRVHFDGNDLLVPVKRV